MVRITSNPPRIPTKTVIKKAVEAVEPTVADKHVEREEPFVERRRNPDRRRQSSERGPFEMRAGQDRRKRPRDSGKIDTEV